MSNINVRKIITVTLWLMVVAILSIFYQLYIEKKEPAYTIIEEEASFKIPETIKKPKALIANTIKGKGFSFSEANNDWHHAILTKKFYEQALDEMKKNNE